MREEDENEGGDAAVVKELRRLQLLVHLGGELDKERELLKAAGGGHTDVVRFLVNDGGANVNTEGKYGWTALMMAAGGGHIDVVRFLVNGGGANVNTEGKYGWTALMMAAGGHIDVVRFLVSDCGANVNTEGKNGETALMMAAGGGHIDVVRFLVNEGGADVNTKDRDGKTATRFATDRGYYNIVRLLTQFVLPERQTSINESGGNVGHNLLTFDRSSSGCIPPSEVELCELTQQRNIGGDFLAKWLDADAVVKLFFPDASHSTFELEVRTWQQLRHPNVLKLYGVCQDGPDVNFFVCEYASQGSLIEYVDLTSSSSRVKPPLMWKYLHEAALGLEYLHERGMIHGDLRCSNILIGSDELAKLSNFGLTGVTKKSSSVNDVVGSMRWQAPEVLKGNPSSRESDVYSLGMCILEAENGAKPWSNESEYVAKLHKRSWNTDSHKSIPYDGWDYDNPGPDPDYTFVRHNDPYFVRRSRELVWRMCCKDPRQRPSLTSIVNELKGLSIEESSDSSHPELEPTSSLDDYLLGEAKEMWLRLQTCMNKCENVEHCELFDKLKHVYNRLQETKQSERLLGQFYSLLADAYETVKMTPEETRVLRLTSTRATTTSMYSFSWRVDALLKALGDFTSEEMDTLWQQQRREQAAVFVSSIADVVLLLQRLKSVEDKAAFLQMLKGDVENPQDTYTEEQLDAIKKTYEEIESRLEGKGDVAKLTPEWFIPWHELTLDRGAHLGAGGFGNVCRAKWLDSDVVVKEVALLGSVGNTDNTSIFDSLLPVSIDETPPDPQTAAKRTKARAMFHHEADIWFGFSHPHVVRLFGACHIGRPFFVCEYATCGTLDNYLRKHPDELWMKLHEAALGVQYLHARGVVHGDLKGNNIVIGSDKKAKVTDFGLCSSLDSEDSSPISSAWHWVAPECLIDKKGEQARPRPTFESDVYSLGMCIVEAMRVVEAVRSGKSSHRCFPWGVLDNIVVKRHATHGKLPSRPTCEDAQWKLVERMCSTNPEERIKISTVVDELQRFAMGSNDTNNQGDHATDVNAVNTNLSAEESVASVIIRARQLLTEWQVDAERQHASLALLYNSLWGNIENMREQIADGDHGAACWSAFHSLIGEALASTANLMGVDKNLISLTQARMRCHTLHRRLGKLCDAYFLERFKDEPQESDFVNANDDEVLHIASLP